jgi:hypothetical protein
MILLDKATIRTLFRADMLLLKHDFAAAESGHPPGDLEESIESFLTSTFKAALLNIPKENPELKAEASALLARVLVHAAGRGDEALAGYVDGIKTIVDLDSDPDKLQRFLQSVRALNPDTDTDDKPELIQ